MDRIVTREDGTLFCLQHDHAYRKPRTCPQCDADPGPEIELDEEFRLPSPPIGCGSLDQYEADAYGVYQRATTAGFARLDAAGDDWHAQVLGVQLLTAGLKALGIAGKHGTARETETVVKAREKRLKQLRSGMRKGRVRH